MISGEGWVLLSGVMEDEGEGRGGNVKDMRDANITEQTAQNRGMTLLRDMMGDKVIEEEMDGWNEQRKTQGT